MSKRRAAWPQGIRWLVAIAAVALALAIVWALFVPVAYWLAHHDVGSAKGPLHETALDNARGRLLTLGAGLFVAGALVFTARNFTLSREGQVTDRYTKAIEQLGSDKLDVRIGGIYALERVALSGANLREADLVGGDLQYARLGDANLECANLECAELTGADFARANLHDVILTGAYLAGANFTDADIDGVEGARLSDRQLEAGRGRPARGR